MEDGAQHFYRYCADIVYGFRIAIQYFGAGFNDWIDRLNKRKVTCFCIYENIKKIRKKIEKTIAIGKKMCYNTRCMCMSHRIIWNSPLRRSA